MCNTETKVEMTSDVFAVPQNEENKPNEQPSTPPSWRQLLSCAASYMAGWLFIDMFIQPDWMLGRWYMFAIGALLTLWQLLILWQQNKSLTSGLKGEGPLWLAAFWCCILFS